MTTNQLKYFVTVAKVLNFTEAGRIHYISQTAITQHIQSLEEQLGVKLFIRDRRHVELTPAGEVFLEEARAILDKMRVAVERTEKAARGLTGHINIGFVKGYEGYEFGTWLKNFHKTYPDIEFQLFRRSHLDLFMQLDKKKLDVIINICYNNTKVEGFHRKFLKSIPLYAALPVDHPYAKLSSIRRFDLREEPFLLTKFYENPLAEDYYIPEMFTSAGFIPQIVGVSSDIETLLLLVSAGVGVTIVPETAIVHFKGAENLAFIPLVGEEERINLIAFWKQNNENPAIEKFLQLFE